MFPPVSFLLSLVGLLIATYTDFKERIIPDWVSFGMLGIGLVLSAYESWLSQSVIPLLIVLVIVALTYGVSYALWRAGAWAGGDVKLFTGLAALNPFNPFFLGAWGNVSFVWAGQEWLSLSAWPVFMFNLFVLSVFMLIPYTALLSLNAVKSFADFKKLSSVAGRGIVEAGVYALGVVLVLDVSVFFSFPSWASFPLLIVFALLPFPLRASLSVLSVGLIFTRTLPGASLLELGSIFILLNLLRVGYGFAQAHVLTYSKKISKLQEGDISGELLVLRGEKVVRERGLTFKTIIKTLGERDLRSVMRMMNPTGEILANPRQAAGFYPDQIARLQSEVKKGRLSDEIKLKASAPFAPAVLLAYVLLNVMGDGPFAWGLFP